MQKIFEIFWLKAVNENQRLLNPHKSSGHSLLPLHAGIKLKEEFVQVSISVGNKTHEEFHAFCYQRIWKLERILPSIFHIRW